MIKFICLSFLFLPSLSIHGQIVDSDLLYLYQIDVQILKKEVPRNIHWASPFSNNYKGELVEGVADLIGLPMSRIKTNKDTSKKYISYTVYRDYNLSELEQIVLKTLENNYKFTTRTILDTCDVWRINVVDSSKLVTFSWLKDSPDGTYGIFFLNDNQDRDFFGQTFTALAQWLEIDSKKYIYATDSDDTMDEPKRYKFIIPVSYERDIDKLKPFMLDKYGIDLVKETQVIEKKYLEFQTSN